MRQDRFVSALVLALCVTGAAHAQSAGSDTQKGATIYVKIGCHQCHGTEGQGGAAGPRIVPAMPFAAFISQLRNPRDVMIPYSAKVLSEEDTKHVHAFLASIPKPRDYKSIDLLR